ncbi:hypothetical protein RHGRI_011595 [Rhododendron griersonianum]|uniref:Uncharacterized protein n=1 Tax=Rhododendron griersonianum TaxID=479676 RepID=A0AAV6KMH2_9ERIC|nr:hypothetical protein RHGRI_011595 [Rhododendron griersonianum]
MGSFDLQSSSPYGRRPLFFRRAAVGYRHPLPQPPPATAAAPCRLPVLMVGGSSTASGSSFSAVDAESCLLSLIGFSVSVLFFCMWQYSRCRRVSLWGPDFCFFFGCDLVFLPFACVRGSRVRPDQSPLSSIWFRSVPPVKFSPSRPDRSFSCLLLDSIGPPGEVFPFPSQSVLFLFFVGIRSVPPVKFPPSRPDRSFSPVPGSVDCSHRLCFTSLMHFL